MLLMHNDEPRLIDKKSPGLFRACHPRMLQADNPKHPHEVLPNQA